jgi:uncharacterized protein (DUF934 family)
MQFIDPHQDRWRPWPDEVDTPTGPEPTGHHLLTLAQWRLARYADASKLAPGHPLGVLLPNDADERELAPDLPRLALVALQFPKWTDGRAYSQARTLRARLGFGGQIRATGEVLVDMLPLLQRTGFDAVQLRADQRLSSAQRALRFFAAHYQGDATEPRPAFRREAMAA